MIKLYKSGMHAAAIAKKMGGVTSTTVRTRLREAGEYGRWRRCKLIECNKRFFSVHDHKIYCCVKHSKKANTRREKGIKVGYHKCLLPECSEVLLSHEGKKFCCSSHSNLHLSRVKEGVYDRLLRLSDDKCLVCNEHLVLDVHHVVLTMGVNGQFKSVKSGPTVLLCPTHHAAIHRGLAKIVKGKFVWTTKIIIDGLR